MNQKPRQHSPFLTSYAAVIFYEYLIEILNSFRSTFRICHSEERSDEESFLYQRCEDPSLSLRMT